VGVGPICTTPIRVGVAGWVPLPLVGNGQKKGECDTLDIFAFSFIFVCTNFRGYLKKIIQTKRHVQFLFKIYFNTLLGRINNPNKGFYLKNFQPRPKSTKNEVFVAII
jgi:hypothetical protein